MDTDYTAKVKNYHKTAQSIHTFVLVALSIMLVFSFLPFFIRYPDLMGDGGEGESMLSVFDNPLMSEYKLHVVLLFAFSVIKAFRVFSSYC